MIVLLEAEVDFVDGCLQKCNHWCNIYMYTKFEKNQIKIVEVPKLLI